jgi:hypothetical protein
MLRRSAKVMLATGGIVAVLGSGVALAADSSVCPWGNTPQSGKATSTAQANGERAQQRLRERDGTGPRHAHQSQRRRSGSGQTPGRGAGNRGANCPYRS